MRYRQLLFALVLTVLVSSCVAYRVRVDLLDPVAAAGTNVESPLKVFLTDGSVAVFPNGARITTDSVFGAGAQYSLDLTTSDSIDALALDDLIGLEAIRADVRVGTTVSNVVRGTMVVALGAFAIHCASPGAKCFGSCPTIYSYDESGEILEAEAFSYSIAPLFEGRDVDRIGVDADVSGVVRLELRNEAFETHYINHLELLEVRHDTHQAAYPNEDGRLLVVGDIAKATSAIDRDGSDRLGELSARDGTAFFSSDDRIRAVTDEDYRDHIDLVFPPPDSRSAALVLRLRNSLLNTILFYDLMLASQGAEALDWLGTGMANIGDAVELGQWFQETMGLRISVLGPTGWEQVAHLSDTGPLAWDEVAVRVPVPEGDELRVRLSFLADEWRIDYAGLAGEVELAESLVVPFARVAPLGGVHNPELAADMALPDEDYLVTGPSGALSLESEPAGTHPDDERTFFLSSQGYYTEWIRPDWIRSSNGFEEFRPSGGTIVRLMARWLEQKGAFQESFFESRIPVR